MEDIMIIHEFKEDNNIFIISESTKKYCKCPNCGAVSDKFHLIKNLLDSIRKYVKRKYLGKLTLLNNSEETNEDGKEDKISRIIINSNISKDKIREEKISNKWDIQKYKFKEI